MKERTLYNTTKPSYSAYLKRHLKLGGTVDNFITKDVFNSLVLLKCFCCGYMPDGKTTFNGIDRIDNDKPYILSNVRPACKHCNYAKGSLSDKLFYEWLRAIIKNNKQLFN